MNIAPVEPRDDDENLCPQCGDGDDDARLCSEECEREWMRDLREEEQFAQGGEDIYEARVAASQEES